MRTFLILALALATAPAAASAVTTGAPIAQETEDAVRRARDVMMGKPDQAYRIGQQLEVHALQATDARERQLALARAYWISGEASIRMNKTAQARRLINRAYQLSLRTGSVKSQADTLLSSGSLRQQEGDRAGALGDYLGAMRLFQSLGDDRSQSIALQYLGNIYVEAADFDRAERYYQQAAETYSAEPRMRLALENNLGNIMMEHRRYPEAIVHQRRAGQIAHDLGDHAVETYVLSNAVRADVLSGNPRKAAVTMRYIQRTMARHRIPQSDDTRTTIAELALAQGRVEDARRIIADVLTRTGNETTATNLDIHDLAYRIYKAHGDYDTALKHSEIAGGIRDGLTKLAISTKSTLMAAQFDYASQELRIARLNQGQMRRDIQDERESADRQRLIFFCVGVVLLTALSALCFVLATLRRSRDNAREVNAKLTQALEEVGAREVAEQRATQRAEHDALTGLPNRRHLYDRLYSQMEGSRAPGEQCSVMLLDLDRFKPINDVHGHDVGDAVLIGVAERLRNIAKEHSAKAIRLGGDEFMFVMTAEQGDEAPAAVAAEIIEAVSAPYEVGEKRLVIGTSIGISRNPDDGATVDDLLRAADIAMYEAKNSGRRTFRFFDEEMVIRLQRREALENDLRSAIANDEIVAVFQPIYCHASESITGFEALARWTHVDQGPISPDEFIPIAEDASLIDDITASIVRQACRAAREWPDDTSISVNLSPLLLRDPWIVARIFGILTSEGLAARRLIIEITENAVIDDIQRAGEVIDSFRAQGIRVSLDDFGKGYSSLSHLRQLSFDHLKLDASFVRTLHEDDSFKIANAVSGLGNALGLPVTAEGVETQRDAEIIRELGFSYAQGYHYGRPMTRELARIAAWPQVEDDVPTLAAAS